MRCDHCGDHMPPEEIGQQTADTMLCHGCLTHATQFLEPLIATGPPADDDDEDDDDSHLDEEDRSAWPTHEPDMGDPVGFNPELDAPPLNAANIMAEMRRMS